MTSTFEAFRADRAPRSDLRDRITAAYRRPETECVPVLLEQATLATDVLVSARSVARRLTEALRTKPRGAGVEGLVQEYALSTEEGVALMCLAEALLRIPDRETRDALIKDKIAGRDWRSHVGQSPSLFVNAATWGLVVTGRLTQTTNERKMATALVRLAGKGGEPLIRKAVDIAMRLMGEQFVAGQTIEEAVARARKPEAQGFRYSYDMLGEAAATAEDAERYYASYDAAIRAIGAASDGRGIYEGPGISIKLSALHPRYSRAQRDRVLAELMPRVTELAVLARQFDIGLNIDAEEADRLELSLELLEAICFEPRLSGWNGIGFVVQAYQKRAPFVLDYVIDLARRSKHRLMIRLVKGAYWDSEIKRAQMDGLEGFPVFTRKIYTDVSYVACARKLLGAVDVVYPQFATHNALTLATIHAMAGQNYYQGQYEFQCLHGMGEPLYEEVVPRSKLNRPCRVYAPVGSHETLLAYLVRRLLENGANSSFVNQIGNPNYPLEKLLADPVESANELTPLGRPHDRIALPADLFGNERRNSDGFDFSNELALQKLADDVTATLGIQHLARPLISGIAERGIERKCVNPADSHDIIGTVEEADASQVARAIGIAAEGGRGWVDTTPDKRAGALERAANLLEARTPELIAVIVREAGKTLPNAIGEIREAVDFLRYYSCQIRSEFANATHVPLGPVVCISPWNFPLAIFTGQVAAALAAGNTVLAKPAEETPLIASLAVKALHEAGVPGSALQLLPGDGRIGAALVADNRVQGVMFTGSTEVARLIQRQLALRANADGAPVPFIAETGGQNALVVDSSALAEQVVADVLQSAFDSTGQRCSALRVLCLQDDVADQTLVMLKGALKELTVGIPDRLSTDVGPVITDDARKIIVEHIDGMRAAGYKVEQQALPASCANGIFVAPAIIEIGSLADLKREVFGPVLHVLRFRKDGLYKLIKDINATGYALTFGIHSRIDETIDDVVGRVNAGNVYINRNLVGAVVGVQPFGGSKLSGTGPKAGGPSYLYRLLSRRPVSGASGQAVPEHASNWVRHLRDKGSPAADVCEAFNTRTLLGREQQLPGPVGEQNVYALRPRGRVLCVANSAEALAAQIGAALAVGSIAVVPQTPFAQGIVDAKTFGDVIEKVAPGTIPACDAALFDGSPEDMKQLAVSLAKSEGPVIPVYRSDPTGYPLDFLVSERSVSHNTAAAGGNASLMSL
ncbi:MAG: trifunctional transcriptional regulator/proline dehydrogenase/L-glutamate gamma-semialdehyde dehydrogenase [Proteobacteria bacterium]|nr:trifunctional transcriptional regulator/proline dehydrogenase/L-glutamate gamma-semialdehyde dehydrogenase [Pseudomonadota bacterium]